MKRTKFVALAALVTVALVEVPAVHAKRNGFPTDTCSGCHRGGRSFKPTVTSDPPVLNPGETATITFHIPAVNGPVAGLYVSSNNKGVFTLIDGQGLQKTSDTSFTHTGSQRATGDETAYRIRWTAPNEPGGVMFDVTSVSSNGNNNASGDSEGAIRFNLSYGCEGVDVYLDQDGDGWGLNDLSGATRMCELLPGYSLKTGDCNDYDARANPEGVEICNLYDDDCDGMINEGLENEVVYKDNDGDGYGGVGAEMKVGCDNGFGYSSTRDDCDDDNRKIHPGADEICNNVDDNCSGRVDEGARASCGVGWCRRLAPSCEGDTCVPGPPRDEQCNAFDDDCDGVVDNGENLCSEGRQCVDGFCLTGQEADEARMNAAADAGPGSSGQGGSGAGAGGSAGASGGGEGSGEGSGNGNGGEAGASGSGKSGPKATGNRIGCGVVPGGLLASGATSFAGVVGMLLGALGLLGKHRRRRRRRCR